jgi:WhiB family redox-sensing transcriptional regulator
MIKDCHHAPIKGTEICPVCDKPDNWQSHAQCLDHDPELWFPYEDDKVTQKQAIKICMSCPVRGFCLESGWEDKFGIWGSFSATDRSILRKLFTLPAERKKKRHIIRTIAHRL